MNIPDNWDLLSTERQPGEDFIEYKERLKLLKLYDRAIKQGVVYDREESADNRRTESARQDLQNNSSSN